MLKSLEKLDKINDRIVELFDEAISFRKEAEKSLLATEREAAGMTFKATVETLEKEILAHSEAKQAITVVDVAELYIVGGQEREEALKDANEDFKNLDNMLKMVELGIGEMRADFVYGLQGRRQ